MPLKGIALNCDTIDDNGFFICMGSGGIPADCVECDRSGGQSHRVDVAKQAE